MEFSNKECPIKVGNGYDVHQIASGLPMWLGGVKIESDCGFVAHSDGDVAIHALCDALLGSLALGDIGHHFPDTRTSGKVWTARNCWQKWWNWFMKRVIL